MKALLYVLGICTGAYAFFAFIGIGDSAVRAGVAAMAWAGALVAIGAAAVIGAIQEASEKNAKESEELRRLLGKTTESRSVGSIPTLEFDAAKAVEAMEAARRR